MKIENINKMQTNNKLREALTMLRKKITDWYMNGWIPHDQYDECKDISESAFGTETRNCEAMENL